MKPEAPTTPELLRHLAIVLSQHLILNSLIDTAPISTTAHYRTKAKKGEPIGEYENLGKVVKASQKQKAAREKTEKRRTVVLMRHEGMDLKGEVYDNLDQNIDARYAQRICMRPM